MLLVLLPLPLLDSSPPGRGRLRLLTGLSWSGASGEPHGRRKHEPAGTLVVVVVAARHMGIDLNMVDGEGQERRPPPPPAVCRELWHACAGPVVALPRRGSLVVYLPQGHLAAAGGGDVAADLPPHVVCRVADVELCVSAALLAHLLCFGGRRCIEAPLF